MERNSVVFGLIMCLHGVDLREALCQYKKPPASLRVMFLRRPKAVRASARRQLRTDALDAVSIACIDVWTFATFLVFFAAPVLL